MQTTTYPWRIWRFLVILSTIAAAAYVPYATTLFGNIQITSGMSMNGFLIITFVQTLIILVLLSLVGLFFSNRGGISNPMLYALLYKKESSRPVGKTLLISGVIGLLTGAGLYSLDLLITPFTSYSLQEGAAIPGWLESLGVCVYGGIAEEIIMRLFILNGILYMTQRIRKSPNTHNVIRIAIGISALLFGILHIASGINAMTMDTLFVIRTISLNMLGGIIFGTVYWKWGLLSAMVTHGFADIVLHVLPNLPKAL